MAKLKAQFRPIQEELPASNSPDGICLDTLNTVTDGNSVLGGRKGFDAFDLNTGTKGEILNMFVATFANGTVYVVTKRVDGKLYHWEVYPDPAPAVSAWTLIKNQWTNNLHSTADRGWFFMWADRMYYFDRIGGTKWDGTSASSTGTGVYKAGLSHNTSPLIAPAVGGGKEGHYHLTHTQYNQKTGEESAMSGFQSGGDAFTRLSGAYGGLNILNWKGYAGDYSIADNAADQLFEANAIRLYCTLGNTERIGLGAGNEQFSYITYLEMEVLKSIAGATYAPIYKSDAIMQTRPRLTNEGGQPPGARYGCWNGSRAVYLDVYPKDHTKLRNVFGAGSIATGVLMYSKARFPCMVPQTILYDITAGGDPDDRNYMVPLGGSNEIATDIAGSITGCCSIGSSFVIFTNSSTYSMSPNAMHPRVVDPIHGAIGFGPVVSTGSAVHAIGKDSWLRISREGVQNVAYEAFTPTMAAIPSTGITATVGGHYSHRGEVWFAVAKTGGTAAKAQRILIWDEGLGGLVSKFDPGNLGTAGVSAMIELSHPKQTPVMLVALDTGVILKWPGTNYTDAATDGGSAVAYACNWRGLFGQSKRGDRLKMSKIRTSMELTPAAGVTLRVAGIQNAAQAAAATGTTKLIPIATNAPAETRLDTGAAVDFDPNANGRMFAVEYLSTAQQGADWKVGDVIMEITRT